MANKDDYLTYYREFFENFAQTVNPNDQLPVKLASYKLVNVEVVGGIIDWTTQYLTQKKCPPNLIGPLIKIVIEEIRKACKKQPILCGFNSSDNAYEPLKLMQTVMAKTNEVCLRYLDNSMLCSLPSPGTPFFSTSVYAVKNSRRRMEDRHVVIHDLNTMFNIQEASPSSYYAVFDGHAGHDAAAYSSAHLHQFLAENKHFISNPVQALLDAFCKTDALFTDKCKVENLSSGTTAVVALLRPKEKILYIAWVGDSQALLVNQGRVLQVVNPHKPSRQDERERIEKQGGCVLLWGTWRVNGQLAVSRAIGDAEYKPFVIAVPDVREVPLDGNEDFLILACDGLWDFVSEDQAARMVYNLVVENPGDVDRISQCLAQLSRRQGSLDNISVIVVFLREPSKIAAEAHWANRNQSTTATMDAGLDNANNPFAIPNGAATDNNIMSQKTEGLLLNLTDNFKQNGTDISPGADFFPKEKSNGKRLASEFDDEDFGPETDVDAVDDMLSPIDTAKGFGEVFTNNNPAEGVCNPFIEHQQKAAVEVERELQRQQSADMEEPRLAREETPTPPADAVHDVSGLEENVAESESEDEWNYIKGDDANKENISPQPEKEVAEIPEEDDAMSQLNPNAAEFVPVSPTRSIPSPACRALINDEVISQSPRRPPTSNDIDISVPNPVEFEKEVKSRPSEVDSYSNGHDESDHNISTDLMENLLNGKNIDDIPEFQPGSTPSKTAANDEFHFGPNAAPFTPSKFLDQSEAGLSTKAIYGDESTATIGTSSFNESAVSHDVIADLNLLNKDSDPMSMSFYADKGESNPFDLNEVQILPDNIDEFLNRPDNNSLFNETFSDLPEHHPLGAPTAPINNDDAVQITDLDKQSYDDEKELASPLEPEKELSDVLKESEECDQSRTPEPTHENLLGGDFCGHVQPIKHETENLPRDVEFISPEPGSKHSEATSSRPESSHENFEETKSPLPEATEVADLLKSQPEGVPRDVELISPELKSSRPSSATHEESSKSPRPESTEVEDLLRAESKSPAVEATEVDDLLGRPDSKQSKSPGIESGEANDLLQREGKSPYPESESKSPEPEVPEVKSPVCEFPLSKSPICERSVSASPVCERPIAESPICQLGGAASPVCERPVSESPVCERPVSESPVCERPVSESPVCERPVSESPVCERPVSESPVCERPVSESPTCVLNGATSPVCERPVSESPVCERPISESPVCQSGGAISPVCERPMSESPVCERPASESPICEMPASESPECQLREVASPVCERPVSKSPIPELEAFTSPSPNQELPKSPVPEPEIAKCPEVKESVPDACQFAPAKSPVPAEPLVCDISAARSPELLEAKSPIQQAPLTPDFTKEEDILNADKHFDIICKSPEDFGQTTPDFTKLDEIQKAQEHFEDVFKAKEVVESAQEDVTSSLKDETSPVPSPLHNETIDESFAAEQTSFDHGLAQDVAEPVPEKGEIVSAEPITNEDVTRFLENSLPVEQISTSNFLASNEERSVPDMLNLNQPLSPSVNLSAQTGEQIDIKTENITPEFAEQAIVTPSEESKQEDVPTAPPAEELVQEPPIEEKKVDQQKEVASSVGVTEAVALTVGGAAVAVAAAAVPAVVKAEKEEKKKPASLAKKPAASKTAAAKPPAKTTAGAPKAASRLSASPRVAAAKTSAAKPPTTTTTSKPSVTKISPKPKPAAPAPTVRKSTEKKPLPNGDVKSTVRSTLSAKRVSSETTPSTTTKPTSRSPTVGTTRSSPTKPPVPKVASARTTSVTKTTTMRTTATGITSSTPKPRPTTLTQKTTATTTSSAAAKPSSAARIPSTKTSPRTAMAPKPRPPTSTTVLKNRVPLSKTVSKAPDTEKLNKESANKLTASRTITSTTRTASATARSATTTVRKVESKLSATRTSKTTTTTMKSTTAKKPTEVVRNITTKGKPAKADKPKENGVSEQVTTTTTTTVVVNNTSAGLIEDSDPQLLKDNSPIDNKLIVEGTALVETNAAD